MIPQSSYQHSSLRYGAFHLISQSAFENNDSDYSKVPGSIREAAHDSGLNTGDYDVYKFDKPISIDDTLCVGLIATNGHTVDVREDFQEDRKAMNTQLGDSFDDQDAIALMKSQAKTYPYSPITIDGQRINFEG